MTARVLAREDGALASRPVGRSGFDIRKAEPLMVADWRPRTSRRLIVLRAPGGDFASPPSGFPRSRCDPAPFSSDLGLP